jgi:hypothetical protein
VLDILAKLDSSAPAYFSAFPFHQPSSTAFRCLADDEWGAIRLVFFREPDFELDPSTVLLARFFTVRSDSAGDATADDSG